MEKCADLLPDHFSFVKGLVDSEDLSLIFRANASAHDRQLKIIARSLERKIKNERLICLKISVNSMKSSLKVLGYN